jgi:hypothetical protein
MEKMTDCPRCGGNACYEQQVNEEVTTHFCFGCGFTTSNLMEVNSKLLTETLETSPELFKDLMFTGTDNRVWFPATVTLPNKGMVFLDGTSKENWKWSAVKSVEILEEEKAKYPEGQTHRMDMKNANAFEQKDFMDALDYINFFDIEVVDQE